MGCGASVPGTNDQQSEANNTPGMRPIRRRIEEFKRRTRVITMSTPSSKQLLHDGEHTDIDENSQMNSPPHDCSKSVYSPIKEEACQDMYTEEKSVESEMKKHAVHDQEKKLEEDRNGREITKRRQHKVEDEDGEVDEDEEFAPGSPSFRMYYIASVDNSLDSEDSIGTNKEEDADVHHDEKNANKTRRTESIVSCEGSITTLVKKEPKGKRFRRGLPNVGQAAVKNLLNVKSCYSPCTNPHAHDNLNNVKVTAT
ncbi:hypothetical protein MKW94_012879 [Papaver nudicaule]|uniref:Uncharacterized protein n=1 Tax=Papaver nudicaule TaxID=74823 RepID=A0AA41S7G6_PAPNU|nr:hypothetical protein [Papaver nudicaule]